MKIKTKINGICLNWKDLEQQRKLLNNEKTTKEWEKISAKVAARKGLISNIYKQLIEIRNLKKSNQKNGQET